MALIEELNDNVCSQLSILNLSLSELLVPEPLNTVVKICESPSTTPPVALPNAVLIS